ncbi:hypothetical protein L2E82_15830 [Cichorium intybus]|uniref:Uncharacterized protein n=1 Tax=Cichorium intybus TaxID=13427 RepID=A0ACB9F4B4_CICIN|nr:hypothetical protein L2E82_15830 [Cichorium intybus]
MITGLFHIPVDQFAQKKVQIKELKLPQFKDQIEKNKTPNPTNCYVLQLQKITVLVIEDTISKLDEALSIDPRKHDAL